MTEIQKAFFIALWHVHAEHGRAGMNWREWAQENGYEGREVDRAYDELAEQGLIEAASLGPYAQITTRGVFECEEAGYIDDEILRPHTKFRTDLLVALSKGRAEHGVNAILDWRSTVAEIENGDKLFRSNEHILADAGYIEWMAQSIKITAKGEHAVQEYLSKRGLLEGLEELKTSTTVTPQQRGHELEKLLELAAKKDGWKVERNARAPGEENDLIVSKGFDYFIVSCKWLSKPCEVEDARNLRDRVIHRPGTRGVLFSMSGFTSGFVTDIEGRMSDAIILPFGPEDVGNALSGEFSSLLLSKFHAVIVNRVFSWS